MSEEPSLLQLAQRYPNGESARVWFEEVY